MWLLKFNLPEDTGSEKPEDAQPPVTQPGEQEPEPPHPQEASTNASTVESQSPKPRKIRSGLTSWWVLLDEDERRLTLEVPRHTKPEYLAQHQTMQPRLTPDYQPVL